MRNRSRCAGVGGDVRGELRELAEIEFFEMEISMKQALGLAALLALALSTVASAQLAIAPPGPDAVTLGSPFPPTSEPGNSQSGPQRYEANPGRQQATEVGAQCGSGAGSGAFGYFGKDNNLKGGANGPQTGENNSSLCGKKPN
jgi:hypothetical protein